MRKHYFGLLIAPLAVILMAGCGSSPVSSVPSSSSQVPASSEIPEGLALSLTYRTTFGTNPTTFNSVKTNEQPNSQHIANFIDGLVENDVHGRIVPSLAESWSFEDLASGKQKWTFEIRDTNWVNAYGQTLLPVKADDWVYAAEQALDPINASEVVYLYFMFIDGAEDYYTAMAAHQEDSSNAKPDFATVGVKAVDDDTLQFTLPKAMSYFPTVLTYSVFFPISRQFVQDIGGWDSYGVITTPSQAQHKIAYNGAFLLQSYVESNAMIYLKNPKYWEAHNVKVDQVLHTYVPEDADFNWARMQFESGVIDGFTVSQNDTAGWEKYVEGAAGTGTKENPAHPNAYTTVGTNYYASYYMSFNYKRPRPLVDTDLTEAEVTNLEKAMANKHFRRAYMLGIDKGALNARRTPSSPNDWTTHLYTINGLVVDSNGKDYVEYMYEKYAEEKSITVEAARALIAPGTAGYRNVTAAQAEMVLAIPQLQAAGVTFPIKAEYWFLQNANLTPYYTAVVNSITNSIGTVTYNSAPFQVLDNRIRTTATSTNAFYNYHYSMQIGNFGWGPDYGDPSTFLNTFKIGGDLTPNLGLTDPTLAQTVLGEYDALLAAADAIVDLEDRFEAYAAAEYQLIFEDAVIIPFMKPYSAGTSVSVSKIQPRTIPNTLYGNSADKFKFVVVYTTVLTSDQVAYFRDKFAAEVED